MSVGQERSSSISNSLSPSSHLREGSVVWEVSMVCLSPQSLGAAPMEVLEQGCGSGQSLPCLRAG